MCPRRFPPAGVSTRDLLIAQAVNRDLRQLLLQRKGGFCYPPHVPRRGAVLCSRVALCSLDILCARETPNKSRRAGVLGTDISYPALPQMWDDLYLLPGRGLHQAQRISRRFRGTLGTEIKGSLPFGVQTHRAPLAATTSTLARAAPVSQSAERRVLHTATGTPRSSPPPWKRTRFSGC